MVIQSLKKLNHPNIVKLKEVRIFLFLIHFDRFIPVFRLSEKTMNCILFSNTWKEIYTS